MPAVLSNPPTFTIVVPYGGGEGTQYCLFAIPAGIWSGANWEITGSINTIAELWVEGNYGDTQNIGPINGPYNYTTAVSNANMAAINAAAGTAWGATMRIDVPIETTMPETFDGVTLFALNLSGSPSSSGASSGTSSRTSSGTGSGKSSSSGGGCIQVGTTGSTSISYDSVDPIYADSSGYWVVFDDSVKVIADSDTPGAWAMAFDEPSNPATAFVGVDPMAASGSYFINYYMPAPASSSSSASLSSSSRISSSSGSSGSSGNDTPIALFVSSFCVTGGSSSSASAGSSSASASIGASSSSAGGGGTSGSSASGGSGPCNPYTDAWFNPGNADATFKYNINGIVFHGTNEQHTDLGTKLSVTSIFGGYVLSLTPPQPLGVCIPSAGTPGQDDPNVSWTNFQSVLAAAFPTWQFIYEGLTKPFPPMSLKGRSYEVLLGRSLGFAKGKIAHFGVRLHLEYCPTTMVGFATPPTTNLHWIQIYWSNCSNTNVGQIVNAIDTGVPFFGEPFIPNGAIGLTLASECESKPQPAIGVFITDDPVSSEVANFPYAAYTYRLETFLVQDMGVVSGKRTINVFDGIQWGWNVAKKGK